VIRKPLRAHAKLRWDGHGRTAASRRGRRDIPHTQCGHQLARRMRSIDAGLASVKRLPRCAGG
jgi:hypothetical protein